MHSRALERERELMRERGELMRERERVHVRGRGRVSCEGEREGEIPVLMVVGPRGQKLHELGTLCPEYPGLRPKYPGRVLHVKLLDSVYLHFTIASIG